MSWRRSGVKHQLQRGVEPGISLKEGARQSRISACPDQIVVGFTDDNDRQGIDAAGLYAPFQRFLPSGSSAWMCVRRELRPNTLLANAMPANAHFVHERAGRIWPSGWGRISSWRGRGSGSRSAHRFPLPVSGRGLRRFVLPPRMCRRCSVPATKRG